MFGLTLPQAMGLPLPEFFALAEEAQRLYTREQAEAFVITRAAFHADEQTARQLLYRLRGG